MSTGYGRGRFGFCWLHRKQQDQLKDSIMSGVINQPRMTLYDTAHNCQTIAVVFFGAESTGGGQGSVCGIGKANVEQMSLCEQLDLDPPLTHRQLGSSLDGVVQGIDKQSGQLGVV